MYRVFRSFTLVCVLALPIVAQQQVKSTNVSLVQLIATPDRFDGMVVDVKGFLSMGREGDLLYLSQADADNSLLSNSIWVRRSEQIGRDRRMLDQKYVRIIGTFRAGFNEQLGVPTGGIPEVKNAQFWSDPLHPIAEKLKGLPGVSK